MSRQARRTGAGAPLHEPFREPDGFSCRTELGVRKQRFRRL